MVPPLAARGLGVAADHRHGARVPPHGLGHLAQPALVAAGEPGRAGLEEHLVGQVQDPRREVAIPAIRVVAMAVTVVVVAAVPVPAVVVVPTIVVAVVVAVGAVGIARRRMAAVVVVAVALAVHRVTDHGAGDRAEHAADPVAGVVVAVARDRAADARAGQTTDDRALGRVLVAVVVVVAAVAASMATGVRVGGAAQRREQDQGAEQPAGGGEVDSRGHVGSSGRRVPQPSTAPERVDSMAV